MTVGDFSFGASEVIISDADGDGANDLLVSDVRNVLLLINNNDPAAPGFADPLAFEIGSTLPPIQEMVAGDVDGDGDIDIAYTDGDSLVTVRRNNGDGTSNTPSLFSVVSVV